LILFIAIILIVKQTFQVMIKYQVVFFGDSVTDSYVVGTYSTRTRARNKADKLDNEYGAYRYSVKPIEV
jgi:lysophospholipase L1-like esterase